MSDINIRLARPDEQETVSACVNIAFTKYVERMGRKPVPMLADYAELIARGVVYVALLQDVVVGVLVMMPDAEGLFIDTLALHPEYQGHGLGRRLLQFAEQYARAANLGRLHLYTNKLMTENLSFYPHLGFVEVEHKAEHGYQRVFFEKVLP
ncbi:GNAT family N-acetyltransferase [Ktedonosporobacter rubrisoli]|uniref:GNAT family N-acetyltransferase n=1 Tax=Ktedonosporobacter rubrisoli TaxID=2509675 RepID=A0A4P6JYZ9_KTERU|nr:GNAT family N-acetyltransferase [Ktedonosporobacter rubrisoli]QBD80306.1 GNAT family N-acetyltransferase [Ktedonosporobacter rubrisoli]